MALIYGFSSVGRALVSKTRCREFESLNPCKLRIDNMGFFKSMGASFKASYMELTQKVSWPTSKELANSAVVVMIASFIIALVVWVIDLSFEYALTFIYRYIRHFIN